MRLSGADLDLARRVEALDLEPVVFKLVRPDAGEKGLSLELADLGAGLYRCFLKLCGWHPGTSVVPTAAIDQVWHAHLLDSAKYRTDCMAVFGRFLDHFPYAGLRGEQDRVAWLDSFARTRALFRDHFGVDVGGEAAVSACFSHGGGADCCVGAAFSACGVRPRPERPGGQAGAGG